MSRERSATNIDCRNARVVKKTNPKMDRLPFVIDVSEPETQGVKGGGVLQ